MKPIEVAILRTIIYADIFQFPLTIEEIHRYLIHNSPVTIETIQQILESSIQLNGLLFFEHGYVALATNATNISRRLQREKITQINLPDSFQYGAILSYLPFVEMVAITGALSVRNPNDLDDDYDYLLVTKPGRVWLARAFAILIVRVSKIWGKNICPNYVLASDDLLQERQNLYMAHEIAQMIPIYGESIYQQMYEINHWVCTYMPNARPLSMRAEQINRNKLGQLFKSLAEKLLQGKIGDLLENWEFRRKAGKFQKQANQPESSAQIDQSHAKGHFQDHGNPVLDQYIQKLQAYQVSAESPVSLVKE